MHRELSYNFLKKGRLTMYKIRVYDKNGVRVDHDAVFATLQAADRYVDYCARFGQRCVIERVRKERKEVRYGD